MSRIDRDMQVGEVLWILGVREVSDFDAFMRNLLKKAKKWDDILKQLKILGFAD